jgi:PilZ domain
MDESEQRQIARDSLFVMAEMRLDDGGEQYRIKVRNLSAGGMMGEGAVRVFRGAQVWISLRNVGWVEGTVAWIQDNRFGVAFREEIDPKIARANGPGGEQAPNLMRRPAPMRSAAGVLRKV